MLTLEAAKLKYIDAFYDNNPQWSKHSCNIDEFAILNNNSTLTFVFDGSGSDLEEWVSNLKVTKVKKMHKGFFQAATAIKPHILRIIKSIKPQKIELITYSRGVFSLIVFAEIKMLYPDIDIDVITFGAPKVGELFKAVALRKILNGVNIRNVVLRGDIVHLLPPVLLGYKKKLPGKTIYCGSLFNWVFPRISKHLQYFDYDFTKKDRVKTIVIHSNGKKEYKQFKNEDDFSKYMTEQFKDEIN